jgi:hypothetical protein
MRSQTALRDGSVPSSTSRFIVTGVFEPKPPHRRNRHWRWIVPVTAAPLVVCCVVLASSFTRGATTTAAKAQEACLAAASAKSLQPADTRFSGVLVADATNSAAATGVATQWVEHATMDDLTGVLGTLQPFENSTHGGFSNGVYIVSAQVAVGNHGPLLRQYLLCLVTIQESTVIVHPSTNLTSPGG